MALVQRPNTVHYYRYVRVGDKVKRVYVGCGDAARLAAAMDSHRRLRRQMERQALLDDQRQWERTCAPLDDLIAVTDLLLTATMLAGMDTIWEQGGDKLDIDKTVKTETEVTGAGKRERADGAGTRAEPATAKAYRDCFGSETPAKAASAEKVADVAAGSEKVWLDQIAGTKNLAALRRDLLGANPSRLEKLLVERVAICWLQAQHADILVAANHAQSDAICSQLAKRQQSAHRLQADSMKELAQLQKLLRPPAQHFCACLNRF